MPASSEIPSVDGTGLSEWPDPSGLVPSTVQNMRLTSPRSGTDNDVSAPVRRALGESAARAASILAETAGKTAEEVKSQLDAIVALIPEFVANSQRGFVEDSRCNVPRRYIDVLRAELLECLMQIPSVDGGETIAVLAALEEVLRRGEMTSTGRFVARLAGAESVNAVVEIAHDIRSPLSSILFLVDTIRRGQSGRVSPVQERQLGLVYGAALGWSTLSSDLIDAVRGERLVDGRPVPFSITEVILGVCAIVQPIGEEKGLPLHVGFPKVDGRIGYASALNRVLLNLTSNALRYTDSGSVSIGCTESADELVEFWIKDTGRGIPEDVLAMLFDGFRPGSMGMRFSSAGLGLAICRNLLEAMGSSLNVETAANEGTRFSFQLRLPVV